MYSNPFVSLLHLLVFFSAARKRQFRRHHSRCCRRTDCLSHWHETTIPGPQGPGHGRDCRQNPQGPREVVSRMDCAGTGEKARRNERKRQRPCLCVCYNITLVGSRMTEFGTEVSFDACRRWKVHNDLLTIESIQNNTHTHKIYDGVLTTTKQNKKEQ